MWSDNASWLIYVTEWIVFTKLILVQLCLFHNRYQHGDEIWGLYVCNMLLHFYPKEVWDIETHKYFISKLTLPSRLNNMLLLLLGIISLLLYLLISCFLVIADVFKVDTNWWWRKILKQKGKYFLKMLYSSQ